MAYTFEQYFQSLDALLENRTQVVMVCAAPGIGVITRTLERCDQAGREAVDIRVEAMDPYEFTMQPVIDLETMSPIEGEQTSRFICEVENAAADGKIVIIDGADIFFDPTFPAAKQMNEQMLAAVKTGARMVWAGGPLMKAAIKHAGRIPPELTAQSVA